MASRYSNGTAGVNRALTCMHIDETSRTAVATADSDAHGTATAFGSNASTDGDGPTVARAGTASAERQETTDPFTASIGRLDNE